MRTKKNLKQLSALVRAVENPSEELREQLLLMDDWDRYKYRVSYLRNKVDYLIAWMRKTQQVKAGRDCVALRDVFYASATIQLRNTVRLYRRLRGKKARTYYEQWKPKTNRLMTSCPRCSKRPQRP